MNCVRGIADRRSIATLMLCLFTVVAAQAQPYCDVLIRPAFTVQSDGLYALFDDVSFSMAQPVSAVWTFGDGTAASPDPAHLFQTAGTYPVCLTLTTQDGSCSSTYCRDVVVPLNDCNGTWTAAFTDVQTSTNTLTFTDISVTQEPTARSWSFGDGTDGSTAPEPTHTWLLPGRHFVDLTRTTGTCVATDAHWVTVDGNASTCGEGFFANFTEASMANDVTLTSQVNALSSTPMVGVWTFGDGDVDTAFVTSHVYAGPGRYQVCLFVAALNGTPADTCFAYVCRTIEVGEALGMEEEDMSQVRVWPVPFSTALYASAPWLDPTCTIRLLDMAGREVYRSPLPSRSVATVIPAYLPPGPYVFEVASAAHRSRVLVIREWTQH